MAVAACDKLLEKRRETKATAWPTFFLKDPTKTTQPVYPRVPAVTKSKILKHKRANLKHIVRLILSLHLHNTMDRLAS